MTPCQGTEFTGENFHRIVTSKMCALQQKNPQSNAVYERMHQTVGNVLRTLS